MQRNLNVPALFHRAPKQCAPSQFTLGIRNTHSTSPDYIHYRFIQPCYFRIPRLETYSHVSTVIR